ncbi:MAG: ATP-binding protein [Eubacterium sp.]|nr:ATP-binding protein [Eubacterium sp.]
MNKIETLKYSADALCLYGAPADGDTLLSSLLRLLHSLDSEAVFRCYADFFRKVAASGSLKQGLSESILTADNAFTRAAAAGTEAQLPPSIHAAVRSDLDKLEALSALTAEDVLAAAPDAYRATLATLPHWELGKAVPPLTDGWAAQTAQLAAFHRQNGYGQFVRNAAFCWQGNTLTPMTALDPIRLTELKNYERQRQQVLENTEAFLNGLPANNVLLYGDRGTGKSSTVHALLNEYRDRGLRMIEISKGTIGKLSQIREAVADCPMRFIVFIDDLSFESHDDAFGELKAALEGSLAGRQGNMLIYATSNRRHLIKENFADRENDVHRSDTLQEELSLSDRFGLSVYFENPDKAEYLDIMLKIADDRGLRTDREQLCVDAELWARRRGGRSPRCARQFVDAVEAKEKRSIS